MSPTTEDKKNLVAYLFLIQNQLWYFKLDWYGLCSEIPEGHMHSFVLKSYIYIKSGCVKLILSNNPCKVQTLPMFLNLKAIHDVEKNTEQTMFFQSIYAIFYIMIIISIFRSAL